MDDKYRWYLLKLKEHEILIRRSFDSFRDIGIEPVLFKGWVTAKFYPWGVPRFFSDTDLAVSKDDFDKARLFCQNDDIQSLNIDLHNEFRHLDSESWGDLFHRSQLIDLDGTAIRILSPEDHLRIICVHWLNDGGAYKDRLWDIHYAVQNRQPDFDWDLCLNTTTTVRRRWIICAIGLAHRHLGLQIDDLSFADEAKIIPAWIEKALEKEWKSQVRLRPLITCLHDRKLMFEQVRKRLPPNPIQSTIEMEGSFDAPSRVYYQLGGFFKRIAPATTKMFMMLSIGRRSK